MTRSIISLLMFVSISPAYALTPNEWQFRQTIDVATPGLVQVNVPTETLNIARPDLSDLRIIDANAKEIIDYDGYRFGHCWDNSRDTCRSELHQICAGRRIKRSEKLAAADLGRPHFQHAHRCIAPRRPFLGRHMGVLAGIY